jgi:hypothetical protein
VDVWSGSLGLRRLLGTAGIAHRVAHDPVAKLWSEGLSALSASDDPEGIRIVTAKLWPDLGDLLDGPDDYPGR